MLSSTATKKSAPSLLPRLSAWIIVILVPILLVLGSIRLLLTETYLQIEYYKTDFPDDYYGFTRADRLNYAPVAISYLVNNAPLDMLEDLRFPDGAALFTAEENSHMRDVQTVIRSVFIVGIVAALLFSGLTIHLLSTGSARIWRAGLRGGAIILLALIAVLVVYIALDWNNFFDRFHNLFFANGTWTFDYSASLIRLFPIRFWQDAALTAGGLAASGALLIIAATLIADRALHRNVNSFSTRMEKDSGHEVVPGSQV